MRASHLTLTFLLFVTAAWGQSQTGQSYQRGAALYDSDNCKDAIPDLESAKTSVNRANLLLGRCYFETGKFPNAIAALSNYLKTETSDLPAMVLLARAHQADGHGENGVKLLEDFLKLHPDETAVRVALADLYTEMGQTAQASAEFQKVVAKREKDPSAHIGLGKLALKEEKWPVAIEEFQKALAVVPNDFDALSGMGIANLKKGDCQAAADPLWQALRLAPTDYSLAKPLAECFEKLKRWSDVLNALQTRTKEEAADEDATARAGRAFQSLKNKEGEEGYYRLVLKTVPSNITAHTALGDLLYDANKKPDAKVEYLEVVKLKPDSPRIQERLGDMADGEAQTEEALSRYGQAATSKDAPDSVRIKAAQKSYSLKKLAETKQYLNAITEPRYSIEVKRMRAQIARDEEDYQTAWKLSSELVAETQDLFPVLKMAGQVAVKVNRIPEAWPLLEKALTMAPSDSEIRYELARVYTNYDELDKLPRARDILTDYINQFSKDYEAYLLLGNVYRKMKDIANAKQNFRLGVDRVPTPTPARLSWAFTSYGIVLAADGDYEQARVELTQATTLDPTDDNALANLALACLELNKTDEMMAARARLESMHSQYLSAVDDQILAKTGKPPDPK